MSVVLSRKAITYNNNYLWESNQHLHVSNQQCLPVVQPDHSGTLRYSCIRVRVKAKKNKANG